jgi:uncharacterized OB-fold protein
MSTTSPRDPSEFAAFWQSVEQGHLSFPKCSDCAEFHWYPMPRCPHCRSANISWTQVNGRGKLHSWTVVRRAFSPEFADKIPYVIGLVEFADAPGIRYLADIINAEPEQLIIDMAVDAVFDTSNPSLVHFQPANL